MVGSIADRLPVVAHATCPLPVVVRAVVDKIAGDFSRKMTVQSSILCVLCKFMKFECKMCDYSEDELMQVG